MPTQAERRESTRTAIVEAAFSAFVEHGAPDVALEDIARAAGVTKSTIHYHFHSRAGLLATVAVRLFQDIEERAMAGDEVTPQSYVRELLLAQAQPVGRVLFTLGDELMRLGRLEGVDPFRHLEARLRELGLSGSTAVASGAVLQFGRQLAFGLAQPHEIPRMLDELAL
ncbi:MAG: TetR/AcrR family transcriptional regulator [Acidobacteriota bacterium]